MLWDVVGAMANPVQVQQLPIHPDEKGLLSLYKDVGVAGKSKVIPCFRRWRLEWRKEKL